MVQIAINKALKQNVPKFNKKEFERAISYALTLTKNHNNFYPLLKEAFFNAGVIFVVLPNISGQEQMEQLKK